MCCLTLTCVTTRKRVNCSLMAGTYPLVAAQSRSIARNTLSAGRRVSDLLYRIAGFQDGQDESQKEPCNADRCRAAVKCHFDRNWFCEEEKERSSHGNAGPVGASERHCVARSLSWSR